jgi:multimeric flavodoxin WrbA
MKALVLNCTLKSADQESNTEALARVVMGALEEHGVESEIIRLTSYNIPPGVTSDEGNGDQWPQIHSKLLDASIVILATPTWLGHPSSVAQRALERMDAMISETDDGLPVAYNRVASVIVTGNEDGSHHVIAEVAQGLIDIGYTVPGQAWTYWNRGPGPGPSYLETTEGHEWSRTTGKTAAAVLVAVARALERSPIPKEAYQA